jgi:hypothetical protein
LVEICGGLWTLLLFSLVDVPKSDDDDTRENVLKVPEIHLLSREKSDGLND